MWKRRIGLEWRKATNGAIFKECTITDIYVDNYADPEPEHLQVSEIEKWLSGVNDLEGYEKFKIVRGKEVYVLWENKVAFRGFPVICGKICSREIITESL